MNTKNVANRAALAFAGVCLATSAMARPIGEVNTAFQMIGPDHKIKIEAFEDPKVEGVTCFVSYAKTGGISGALGIAEDTSDASIACRQTGPIRYREPITADKNGEDVFKKSSSWAFKKMHVTRMFDQATASLIYLTWSDKIVDGSPKNAITAITPMPWGTQMPEAPKLAK